LLVDLLRSLRYFFENKKNKFLQIYNYLVSIVLGIGYDEKVLNWILKYTEQANCNRAPGSSTFDCRVPNLRGQLYHLVVDDEQ